MYATNAGLGSTLQQRLGLLFAGLRKRCNVYCFLRFISA